MPRVLVSGSISYDTLLRIDADFRSTMRTKTESLSVGYHCQERHQTFGGIAANIAFHLARQSIDASPVAAVGNDFQAYADWMDANNVDRSLLSHVDDEPTAQVYILSDSHENQVLALYLGAMKYSRDIRLSNEKADLAVVGPDERDAFMQRVKDFDRIGVPIMLDPGQSITSLSADDIRTALAKSRWLVVNEFECSFLESLTGATALDISRLVEALVVTRGADGCSIFFGREKINVDSVSPDSVVDPTGCGDTFRAGLITGMLSGSDLADAARLGASLAAETLAHLGAQWQRATP